MGGWFSSFFQEQQAYRYRHDKLRSGALWSVCFPPQWSLTVTICRVLDDVAATHTTSACVYIATRGRKEVD